MALLKVLLAVGAQANQVNHPGVTPLLAAFQNDRAEVVDRLVAAGARTPTGQS
jgi:ankyrin repeat protein